MPWPVSMYLIIKFFHVIFVMLWAGSAIGAFWFVLVARKERMDSGNENEELIRRDDWVRHHFNHVLKIEHIAFPLVIATGLAMVFLANWDMGTGWLFWKLGIVVLIIIPMEIIDTWLSHFYVPPTISNKQHSMTAYNKAIRVQEFFLKIATPTVAITIPVIMFLAITKPY